MSTAKTFGLRDVKLAELNASDVPGSLVDLPAARTFSFEPTVDSETLEGDDSVVSIRETPETIEWSLEHGGISLDAWEILGGGTMTMTGVTPNRKWKLARLATDVRPYFTAIGQSIGDAGNDIHVRLYKCKCTSGPSGELNNGEFLVTECSGEAIADVGSKLYDIIIKETSGVIALADFA